MLALHFENPIALGRHSLGPASYFRLAGNSLRVGPHDQEAARHERGSWQTDRGPFIILFTLDPTVIHFEREDGSASVPYGPFDGLRLVDGILRPGPRFDTALARLDEATEAWHVHPEQQWYAAAVLAAP